MPMYAMATVPLIVSLPRSARQVWHADDASALGLVEDLRALWDELSSFGPKYGYYPNSSKTWLVTKEVCHSRAIAAFQDTGINVTSVGRPYLGATLGTPAYINQFVMIYGFFLLLPQHSHTQHLPPLVMGYLASGPTSVGHCHNSPSLIGQPPPSDSHRDLFALPVRLGD